MTNVDVAAVAIWCDRRGKKHEARTHTAYSPVGCVARVHCSKIKLQQNIGTLQC